MVLVTLIGLILTTFLLILLLVKSEKFKDDYVLLTYLLLSVFHELFFYLDYSNTTITSKI
jgi:hypothetical protein